MERNVLEYVDHLHEHFLYPCSINERGRYNVPGSPIEGYRLRHLLAFQEKFLLTTVPSIQHRDA